jgi:diguanylate cyclase (GGDEF)-like protein/PAS domain S-box-containing protein
MAVDTTPSAGDTEAPAQPTPAEALVRMAEAEDTLRAIGAGEVDAFVVSDGAAGRRVFSLETADRPYRIFVESMRDGAATLAPSGLILYANRRLAELLGCPRDDIVGSPLSQFLAGGTRLRPEKLRGLLGEGGTLELDLLNGNGVAVPVLVGTSPLEVDGDRLACLTFTDLTEIRARDMEIAGLAVAQAERMADLENAQAALTRQATHDALTGLPNRVLLVDRITQALGGATRSGRRTAILFVDLDDFKQVNDTQGHAAGDFVLQTVAKRLVAALRPMDTVARIGGDEFVVLAPDIDSPLHAADMSRRLVSALSRRPAGNVGPMGASVGVSVSEGGRGTAEILLKEADVAMYQAKSRGGGRAEVFDATLDLQMKQRTAAHRMLQAALDNRQIMVQYQPIVDLANGSFASFEALARIASSDGSMLSPADFIPIAEASGLILPLGAEVLEMACDAARRWPTMPAESPAAVAVNLSPRQFESGDLPSVIRETLKRSGLEPERLHLELTETAIIDLHPGLLQQLGRIRDLGVQIGLDDFGTGYASLIHLRRLPLTFVKIDQTFVQGIGTDDEDERIVAAVVDLARNLGLRSIAEGIQTSDQLDRLRELGCDQGQGYWYAQPMPADSVATAIGIQTR